mmetsp:Transcript_52473/g.162911  ORF Transcript_52473/g.162911 Transcript_52473/m.162911 type:complete len:355 (-) Transcript_52473:18-1082(-)
MEVPARETQEREEYRDVDPHGMANHVEDRHLDRETVGRGHVLELVLGRPQSLGDRSPHAAAHVGVEDGVVPLRRQRHPMQEKPARVAHEPDGVHRGGTSEDVAEGPHLGKVLEEEETGPSIMHPLVLPAHGVEHQGGEEVDEHGGHVVRIVEDERVAHDARRQEQRAAAQAPAGRKDVSPDVRVHEPRRKEALYDQGEHREDRGKVAHPTKVKPIGVLRKGLRVDLVPPAHGKEHANLEQVNHPEVLRNGTETPGDEERVGDPADEVPLRQPPMLQLLPAGLDRVQAAADHVKLLLRELLPERAGALVSGMPRLAAREQRLLRHGAQTLSPPAQRVGRREVSKGGEAWRTRTDG